MEGKVIKFLLPTLPPSCNRLIQIDYVRRRVYLAEEPRRWKSDMQALVPRFEIPESSLLQIDYTAYYPWLHANGKRRRLDVSNFMKLLHDTVCGRIGVDDSRVVSGSFAAVDDVNSRVEVVLTEVTESEWRK